MQKHSKYLHDVGNQWKSVISHHKALIHTQHNATIIERKRLYKISSTSQKLHQYTTQQSYTLSLLFTKSASYLALLCRSHVFPFAQYLPFLSSISIFKHPAMSSTFSAIWCDLGSYRTSLEILNASLRLADTVNICHCHSTSFIFWSKHR